MLIMLLFCKIPYVRHHNDTTWCNNSGTGVNDYTGPIEISVCWADSRGQAPKCLLRWESLEHVLSKSKLVTVPLCSTIANIICSLVFSKVQMSCHDQLSWRQSIARVYASLIDISPPQTFLNFHYDFGYVMNLGHRVDSGQYLNCLCL